MAAARGTMTPRTMATDLEAGLAHALADELGRLTDALAELSSSLEGDPQVVRRHMEALQQVDRVSQVHGEIAGILRATGGSVARLANLRLEDLKARLQGATAVPPAAPPPADVPHAPFREDRHIVQADIRVWFEGEMLASLGLVDLSAGGIGTEGLIQLDVGAAVRVEFPDGTMLSGRTVWRDGFCSGIHFDRTLGVGALDRLHAALLENPFF